MSLVLYGHQKETCSNLNELYKKHRSAGAMIPTGGGKSYVGMTQMIAANNNPNFKGILEDGTVQFEKNGTVVNDANIYYITPTNDIALQIQIDIAESILDLSEDEISKMKAGELEKIVKQAFPNLSFICYQGMNTIDLDNAAPDLIILDEVHRSGAKTFKPYIEKLLGFDAIDPKMLDNMSAKEIGEFLRSKPKKNPNALKEKDNIQLLSLSATPERDVDEVDMIRYWNELIGDYSEEELSANNRVDLASKLTLPEAKKRGILKIPTIVSFDANLVDTEQYQFLVEQTTNESISPSLRAETLLVLKNINKQIFGENYPDFHLLSPEEQEKLKFDHNADTLAQSIIDGKLKLKGKYIIFSKPNKNKDGVIENDEEIVDENKEINNNLTVKNLKKQYKDIESLINEAIKRANINKKIELNPSYLSSQGFSIEENKNTLLTFNNINTEKEQEEKMHFITATQKLDEGVHIKDITGSFMLKAIAEANEKITLRGQSIRFLQEFGRNMASGSKSQKVLFDYVGNVFRQSMNKAVPEEQMVEEFKLNPTQQMLAHGFKEIQNKIPPRGQLNDEYTQLVQVLNILRSYNSPVTFDKISKTLSATLDNKYFQENKEKILKDLTNAGLANILNAKGGYLLQKKLADASKLLYNGGKVFSTFNIKELEELGIIDKTSEKGLIEFSKSCFKTDPNGYIICAPLAQLFYQNIKTGTPYNENGVDIDGYKIDQFDEITGKDKDGYYRNGFNDEGIHRDTGTIHDKNGFMEDGNNILTGEPVDLLGYNCKGYKPVPFNDVDKEGNRVEIKDAVIDRDGNFHKVFVDPETGIADLNKVNKVGEKFYQLKNGKKIDSHGFLSTKNYNLISEIKGRDPRFIHRLTTRRKKGEMVTEEFCFDRQGNCYEGNSLYNLHSNRDSYGYDIDNFDQNGFNPKGIHRATGTKYDTQGMKKEEFSKVAIQVKNIIRELKLEDDFNEFNFNSSGKNNITNSYLDMYGFSLLDYAAKEPTKKNIYGFTPKDVPVSVFNMKTDELTTFLYKNYDYNGEHFKVNMLGTTTKGINPKTGKKDVSLKLMRKYTNDCIKNKMPEEEFIINFAKINNIMIPDAKAYVKTALNKAMQLYRICPEYAKEKETKDMMKIISMSSSETLKETLFKNIPDLSRTLTQDVSDLTSRIQDIDKTIQRTRDKDRVIRLKQTMEKLTNKKQNLIEIQNKDMDER